MWKALWANKMIAITVVMFVMLVPILIGLWWYIVNL